MGWQAALGAISGGVQAGAGLLSPVLASYANANQARINRDFSRDMYYQELKDSQDAATLAWQRSTDYKYLMEQYRKAGLNPYMMAGGSSNAPAAHVNTSKGVANADMSSLSMMGHNMTGALLALSQVKKNNAETKKTEVETDGIDFDVSLKKAYEPITRQLGIALTSQTIDNMKSTNENVKKATELLGENIKGQRLQNALLQIENRFKEKKEELGLKAIELQNDYTSENINKIKSEIRFIDRQNKQLDIISSKIISDIQFNSSQIGVNAKLQDKIGNEALQSLAYTGLLNEQAITESSLRKARKQNIRSGTFVNYARTAHDFESAKDIQKTRAFRQFNTFTGGLKNLSGSIPLPRIGK